MVLWALLLLALLATVFGGNARTEVNLARNLVENAQAEALADAGIYRAIVGLAMEPQEGGFSGDGRVYQWQASGGEVRFSIRDEGGKIDLNQAPDILLRELFVAVGVDAERSAELADAIVDFRDEDSDKRPNGAEERDYASAGSRLRTKEPAVRTGRRAYLCARHDPGRVPKSGSVAHRSRPGGKSACVHGSSRGA